MSSIQSQRSATKTAAKRRAEIRRRNRERLRQFGAIFFVFIFVCGTVALVFPQTFSIAQPAGQTTLPATTPAPGASNPDTQTQATPANNAVSQLVQQGDEAFAESDWATAASRYKAALGLSPGNATLHFKAGKAFINNKDYTNGVDQLQQALSANPNASFAEEARSLINTYKGQATPASGGAASGAAGGVGASGALTSTAPLTATNTVTP